METSEIIKKRRKELGLTLEQVADALGVNKSTVMRYENNDIEKMPISVIQPLSIVLRCTPMYLLGLEDEPNEAGALYKAYQAADEKTKKAVCILLGMPYREN